MNIDATAPVNARVAAPHCTGCTGGWSLAVSGDDHCLLLRHVPRCNNSSGARLNGEIAIDDRDVRLMVTSTPMW